MILSDLAKRLRAQHAMSMQDVANIAGFSKQHVFEIEHGVATDIRVSTLLGLSRALRVKPEILLESVRLTLHPEPPGMEAAGE